MANVIEIDDIALSVRGRNTGSSLRIAGGREQVCPEFFRIGFADSNGTLAIGQFHKPSIVSVPRCRLLLPSDRLYPFPIIFNFFSFSDPTHPIALTSLFFHCLLLSILTPPFNMGALGGLMATTAQIFANRENSKLSTGPRTPEGKAASSQNSKAHGLSAVDPVLPHEDHNQFNALLERYQSDFAPASAHEEFLVSQMAGARWKLDRAERIEVAMFAALESPGDAATTEALMAQAFMDKDTGNGFARLDRYRASLERTYYRCARELRATRKQQNEANSTELAENKFEKLLKRMLDAPPPGFEFKPKLVPIDPNDKPA